MSVPFWELIIRSVVSGIIVSIPLLIVSIVLLVIVFTRNDEGGSDNG